MPLLKGKGLGCLKDPEDKRDLRLTRLPLAKRKKLPSKVDYRRRMSRVNNQGAEGTCVGFAIVDGMKEFQELREWKRSRPLSVRYVYNQAKRIDGMPEEEGTTIRAAMKVLKNKGVPPEKCWPYKPYQTDKSCKDADKKAAKYKISRYVRLKNIQEMKESLHTNGPFVAGVIVFESWTQVRSNGAISWPDDVHAIVGGHAICIVGYDDKKERFRFKNSWGKKWGDNGYGNLSYEYMRSFLVDAWSGKDILHKPRKRKKKGKKKGKSRKKG